MCFIISKCYAVKFHTVLHAEIWGKMVCLWEAEQVICCVQLFLATLTSYFLFLIVT